jgi:hypothetical protein
VGSPIDVDLILNSSFLGERRRAHVGAFSGARAHSFRCALEVTTLLGDARTLSVSVVSGEVVRRLQVLTRNVTELLGVTVGHPGDVGVDRHEPSR